MGGRHGTIDLTPGRVRAIGGGATGKAVALEATLDA